MTNPLRPEPQEFAPPLLEVRQSPGKGRGVFASERIVTGQLIERAPVIAFSKEQWTLVEKTLFYDYIFDWGPGREGGALVLGFGSIYNHDYQPNAFYIRKEAEDYLEFYALTDIPAGEEITVNYNGKPDCQDPLWFSPLN